MLSLLRLRSGRRRILSECQSQDSQHLNSSSSQHSTIIIMDSQADKTVARSISHLSLRYTATTTISLFFRFSIAPFITAILVVRARHSRHTRAARRQSAAPVRAATSNANSKSRETGAALASAAAPGHLFRVFRSV